MARDQQEALAGLRKTPQPSAVVGGLRDDVAVGAQQAGDAVEELAAAIGDARHVLEQDQLGEIVLERFQHQEDAAQRQLVQRLILATLAFGLTEQPREPFAGRAQEDDVRPLVPGSGVDVGRRRLAPPGRWCMTVEGFVLLAIEQVEHRAGHAGEPREVADAAAVDVDAPDAAVVRNHVADPGRAAVEAARSTPQSAKQVEVSDFTPVEQRARAVRHVTPPPAESRGAARRGCGRGARPSRC